MDNHLYIPAFGVLGGEEVIAYREGKCFYKRVIKYSNRTMSSLKRGVTGLVEQLLVPLVVSLRGKNKEAKLRVQL